MTDTRPPRFFLSHEAIAGDRAILTGSERHHLRVRRARPGARVELFDDRGREFVGVITRLTAERAELTVTELAARPRESPLDLTLALALLKADKVDLVIEKATELGVTGIVLFASERTLADCTARRLERWRRIAVSAAKQCGRRCIPAIEGPVPLDAIAARAADLRVVCWESAGPSDRWPQQSAVSSALVAVGPEGGLTAAEVARLQQAGFHPVSLGPRVLRGETAAIAAVVLAQARWGDLGG